MKERDNIYKIIIFFSSLSIFIIVFLIYPTFKEIQNDVKKMISNKEGLNFINSEIIELENFKKNYKNYQENFKKIDRLFIDSGNPVGFIEFLEKEAAALKVNAEINLNTPITNENSKKQTVGEFQISAKGSFSNVLELSERMETGSYLISVSNLTIKKLDRPKNTIQADFLIKALNKQ